MGFARHIPTTWEEVATQPLFNNPRIINPDTNRPWVKQSSPFATVPDRRIKYVWQLTSFNRISYKSDPVVGRTTWLSPATLNHNMTLHNNAPVRRTHAEWQSLIRSIPQTWRDCVRRVTKPMHKTSFLRLDLLCKLTVPSAMSTDITTGTSNTSGWSLRAHWYTSMPRRNPTLQSATGSTGRNSLILNDYGSYLTHQPTSQHSH